MKQGRPDVPERGDTEEVLLQKTALAEAAFADMKAKVAQLEAAHHKTARQCGRRPPRGVLGRYPRDGGAGDYIGF